MTIQAVYRALKSKKPAVIKEQGAPRYVILDWKTYRQWEDAKEDYEDAARLLEALSDSKNRKRVAYSKLK